MGGRLLGIRQHYGDEAAFVISWFLADLPDERPAGVMGLWSWAEIPERAASGDLREQRYVQSYLATIERTVRQEDPRAVYMPWLAKEWLRYRRVVLAPEWHSGTVWHSVGSILDWAVATRPSIFDYTLTTASRAAHVWHEELQRRVVKRGGAPGKVVHRWPDRWTLQELPTKQHLDEEGMVMGHCVGSGGYWPRVQSGQIRIWSLRDARGRSRVTLELGVAGDEVKTVLQVQGKSDKPAAPRHAQRLLEVPALRDAHDRSGVLLRAKQIGQGRAAHLADEGTWCEILEAPRGRASRDRVRRLRAAACALYEDDPEHFVGGCADISYTLWLAAQRLGWTGIEIVSGTACPRGEIEPTWHVWLRVGGQRVDPTWGFRRTPRAEYRGDVLATEEERIDNLEGFFGVMELADTDYWNSTIESVLPILWGKP